MDVAVGERRTPESLLRLHWVELIDRVWANHVTDRLYERGIISKRHKDEIEEKSARGSGVAARRHVDEELEAVR